MYNDNRVYLERSNSECKANGSADTLFAKHFKFYLKHICCGAHSTGMEETKSNNSTMFEIEN